MSKVGILGGAFDPPHIGHIELAAQVKKQLKLSNVLIIPTFAPPHKSAGTTAYEDRLEMARLAFEGMEGFEVSDIERQLGGISYTIDTVRALKDHYPDTHKVEGKLELYPIIGADQLYTIEKWYRHEALLKESHVVAVTRGDSSYTDMAEYANEIGRIRVLDLAIPDISSTAVREKLAAGGDVSGLLPEKVLSYIRERGLYRG